ncbi:MAG: hypothetical protein M3R04_04490 [bacterium]|nr:hypothetical protein [bacterium]
MPAVPPGTGEHPVCLTVITSGDLAKSQQFYTELFSWSISPISAELSGGTTTAGQAVALLTALPQGFPAMVPFVKVASIDETVALMLPSVSPRNRRRGMHQASAILPE